MRTFVHAAFLAGLFLPGTAYAADLDYPYEPPAPPPVVVAPPPPPVVAVLPPRCVFYRPCVRPWRFGYWRRPWGYPGPRPFVGPRPYADVPPPAGYGYGQERFDHYGYAERGPDGQRFDDHRPYGPRSPDPREGYQGPRERYGEGRPYADPLGHDRGRFDRDGDERRGSDRFDRGPGYGRGGSGYRDEPG